MPPPLLVDADRGAAAPGGVVFRRSVSPPRLRMESLFTPLADISLVWLAWGCGGLTTAGHRSLAAGAKELG